MPCVRHNGSLAFRTIYGEELVWLMIGIGISYRHYYLTSLDIELAAPELLVYPELLKVHLAALLYLSFVFSGFLSLYLNGSAVTAVFKLYLTAERPALTKVVAYVETYVWQVETAVARIILISLRVFVAVKALTVIVASHHRLAITTDVQARYRIDKFCCLTILGVRFLLFVSVLPNLIGSTRGAINICVCSLCHCAHCYPAGKHGCNQCLRCHFS